MRALKSRGKHPDEENVTPKRERTSEFICLASIFLPRKEEVKRGHNKIRLEAKRRANINVVMGGGGNGGDQPRREDETIADQFGNHSTIGKIWDEAVENTNKTVDEMVAWVANATNSSRKMIEEAIEDIEDIATTGHFGVDGTNTTIPIEMSETESRMEMFRNVPEFRYASEAALGASSSSSESSNREYAVRRGGLSKSEMLLRNVNEYERKDYFIYGSVLMALCVAVFVAAVLKKHAQKFRENEREERREGKERDYDMVDNGDVENVALMKSIVGKIQYGSVV